MTASGGSQKPGIIARRGLMLVLSSPSGAGKTTLSRMLLAADANVELSVSVTTPSRGRARSAVATIISSMRLASRTWSGRASSWNPRRCSAIVTARRACRSRRRSRAGRDVLFDIDWQGTQQLREKAARDLVSIFVLPPSIPELERRLHARALD